MSDWNNFKASFAQKCNNAEADMSTSKFTRGPWFVGPDGIHVYDKRVWFDDDGCRCGETPNIIISVSPEMPEVVSLVAAAPELLEALESIRRYGLDTLSGRADGGSDDREWQREAVNEMTKRARIAIEKATGSQS